MANTSFNDRLRKVAANDGKGEITKDDFAAYIATVTEMLGATTALVEGSDFPKTKRPKVMKAIQAFDSSRGQLAHKAEEKTIDTLVLTEYLQSLTAFLDILNTNVKPYLIS